MRNNQKENFYKRLRELSDIKSANNPASSLSNSTLIDYTRANDGVALGIIKENHNYFIKTSSSQNNKLGAEDFAYIGGIENKFKYQYPSLSEAEKNRNFYLKTLNESSNKKFNVVKVNESNTLKAVKEKEIAEVPSKPAIAVEKQAPKAKVVDQTKESSKKPIVVNKQAKVVVKEGFEKEEENNDLPLDDEKNDIEAAADALDDMGINNDGGSESPEGEASPEPEGEALPEPEATPSPEGDAGVESPESEIGTESPEGDAGAEGGDVESPEGEASADSGEGETDGEASIKDIEKLTGKVTQKIRSTVMTPEMTKGFLKSYISAFSNKLNDLEHDDKKELANSILKSNDEEGEEIGESDIEEAINQHLAEMGINDDENVQNVKTFESYMNERGYSSEKIEEISLMEMVSLMNGYTNECGEEPDAEGMSNYVTPDVMDKLQESGNALFEDLMKPFGEKIKSNKKNYASEALIPSVNEDFDGTEEEEEEEEEGEESEENDSLETTDLEDIAIAPSADAIGINSVLDKPSNQQKSVTVDMKNDTVNVTMNESELKLRKIIQKKLVEKLNGKKPSINESKKSALSVMIDELVNEAIQKRRDSIEKRLLRK